MAQIQTPVWQFRAIENFLRAALIKETASAGDSVVQIGCYQGLDFGKFERQKIGHYLGIEFEARRAETARGRLQAKGNPYPSTFMSWDELKRSSASSEPSPHAGAYNYVYAFAELDAMLFESEDNLKSVMKTMSTILKPGGLFIGSFLDSSELFTKLVKQHQHGKSSFTLSKNLATFDFDPQVASSILNSASSKRFGLSFTFTIEEQQRKMNLIHTPSFLEEATRSGFELVDMPNSAEYFEEAKRNHPDLRKAIPSAKPTNPQQAKSSLIVLPEQKEVLGFYTIFILRKM